MNNEWYYLDAFNQPQGPYSTETIQSKARDSDFYVWKEGLSDWRLASSLVEIVPPQAASEKRVYNIHLSPAASSPVVLDEHGQPKNKNFNAVQNVGKSLDELSGLCKGILFDGKLDDKEIILLDRWLTDNAHVAQYWPADVIAARIKEILADGVITAEESKELQIILEKAIGGKPDVQQVTNLATRLPLTEPPPDILISGRTFCFTGKFVFGTRTRCQAAVSSLGGMSASNVSRVLDYLVIGTIASRDWIHTTHGRKIEAALDNGDKTKIVSEEHWAKFITKI